MRAIAVILATFLATSTLASINCFINEEGQPAEQMEKNGDKYQKLIKDYEFTVTVKADPFGLESLHYDIYNTDDVLHIEGESPSPSLEQPVSLYFNLDLSGRSQDASYRLKCLR